MEGEPVVGLVSPNTCMSTRIGAVLTSSSWTLEQGWVTRRAIVTGVEGHWLTTVLDPEVQQGVDWS